MNTEHLQVEAVEGTPEKLLRCVPLSYQSPHFRDQLWGHPLSIHPCLEVEILFIASGSLFFF